MCASRKEHALKLKLADIIIYPGDIYLHWKSERPCGDTHTTVAVLNLSG